MQIELDESDDLLPEYDLDFSKSKPNRFAERYKKMIMHVGIAPDIADDFPTEESVNDALREYLKIIKSTPTETVRS